MQCSDFLNSCCERLLNAWAAREFVADTVDVALVFDALVKLRDSVSGGSFFEEGLSIDDLPF